MYELIPAGSQSFYINCPARMGVFVTRDGAWLIDSGNDKDTGRKVLKIFAAQGWELKAIINTHSNADHIGGNHYLQKQTGCQIFAQGIEAAFTRYPILEPSFLYGGYPCKDLRHKFLMAAESDVLPIPSAPSDFAAAGLPADIEIFPLPGHFFDMIGVRTPDETVFLADCISSEATLEKYQIGFIYDVSGYLNTLDFVESIEARLFVPAHAEAAEDIRPLVRLNRSKVLEIAEQLTEFCREPLCFEHILQRTFQKYSLNMNFEQYALIGSTIRSYLSWLKDSGRLDVEFQNNMLLWKRI